MILKTIKLKNFRNWDFLTLELNTENILIGGNAQGKTNILEAISLVSTTKSFRAKDIDLVQEKKDFFALEGDFGENKKIRLVVEKNGELSKKTIQRNGKKVKAREILGDFITVLFLPQDVSFFTDSPEVRRKYLDSTLCQADKEYLDNLSSYKKVLEQRNSLLKRIKDNLAAKEDLVVWDEKLILLGIKIIQKRKEYLEISSRYLSEIHPRLMGENENIEIFYQSKAENKDSFARRLNERQDLDIILGATSTGPHRDDVLFSKGGSPVASFSSRGENRILVLGLKLAEGRYFKEKIGKEVTFLFDDVFSELDKKRRDLLLMMVKGNPFVITTTDYDYISKEHLLNPKVLEIKDQKVEELKVKNE